jgi:hypothetical protein
MTRSAKTVNLTLLSDNHSGAGSIARLTTSSPPPPGRCYHSSVPAEAGNSLPQDLIELAFGEGSVLAVLQQVLFTDWSISIVTPQ